MIFEKKKKLEKKESPLVNIPPLSFNSYNLALSRKKAAIKITVFWRDRSAVFPPYFD